MALLEQTRESLSRLGHRLRVARLERGDSMQVFAQRVGVSESTLRAMEQGSATVQVGSWAAALWVLDRLDELQAVLVERTSLLDQARMAPTRRRQRAPRRPRTG